ncbi:hypothetical protein [Rothia mucilaginosa]|uniref:hypothetical protein n=1 Tax=Rothia mucilaginosa TaxID=43675 RepID=UPI00288939EF|nr:hypothetical protein [Rothia mucilaginosa]
MSQLPENNEAFDYNPEYSEPHQGDDNGPLGAVASGGQLLLANGLSDDVLSKETGRFAANLSLLFGALSFACIPGIPSSVYFIPLALILSALGIWQARVARRHGVYAAVGMIVNVAGMIIFMLLGALALFLTILFSGLH